MKCLTEPGFGREERYLIGLAKRRLGRLSKSQLARIRAQGGCLQCADNMLKGVHTCGIQHMQARPLSRREEFEEWVRINKAPLLRLSQAQIALRPAGEVYLLESEVLK